MLDFFVVISEGIMCYVIFIFSCWLFDDPVMLKKMYKLLRWSDSRVPTQFDTAVVMIVLAVAFFLLPDVLKIVVCTLSVGIWVGTKISNRNKE